jgi:hypothetical protein
MLLNDLEINKEAEEKPKKVENPFKKLVLISEKASENCVCVDDWNNYNVYDSLSEHLESNPITSKLEDFDENDSDW